MKLPYQWLTELVNVPAGVEDVARALGLRGFEVASVENGRQPAIDFEITANRPDCLNVLGLAREASAAFGVPLQLPDRTMPPAGQPQPIDIVIEDAELCPRYCAQVFEVRSTGRSPEWMQERLEAAGVRSISAIVDVTNYVMLEMGQPTHAFDYAALAGRALRIRRARAGEKLRTLDGVDRDLQPDMLVIADGERAQAIGGVMGGAPSEIGSNTRLMVLESAYFKPASVRRTSKRLGLKTEASTRFERGADVNAAPIAIARAAALLQQIGAAQPLGPMIDKYPVPQPSLTLTLRSSRIERVLGTRVDDSDIPLRLQPLGFSLEARRPTPDARQSATRTSDLGPRTSDLEWIVSIPSFRVDVLREIDLIEEIARHDGYVGLPATFPELGAAQAPPDARTLRDRRLRQVLTACGLSEAMTFAFIEAASAGPFAAADHGKRAADYAEYADKRAADHADNAEQAGKRAAGHTTKQAADYADHADKRAAGHTTEQAADSADHADKRAAGHTTKRAADYADHADKRVADHADKRAADHADNAEQADNAELVRVQNPLSEKFAVLRPSLLPGLVDAAAHNRRREHADVRLFETGTRFCPTGERRSVAAVWAGAGAKPHWSSADRPADFYDVKGVVEAVARAFGVWIEFEPVEVSYMVPGRAAVVVSHPKALGFVGQIDPAIAEARGMPAGDVVWAFELEADLLPSADVVDELRTESLPRFPSVVRDLSVLVDSTLPAGAVRGTIRSSAPATLVEITEFDRYRGKGIPEGRVSLSLRLTFRSPERTLTDAEVDQAMDAVVAALANAHGATRR